MKALIMHKDRKIRYDDIEEPKMGEGEVLIQVEACGICGTDMHVYKGMDCTWQLPGVIGHEFSGTVLSCGQGCHTIKAGDKVTAQPLINCMECDLCQHGKTNLCTNIRLVGGEICGAMAEKVVVPEVNLMKLPRGIPLKYGALAEPAATAVHAVNRLRETRYSLVVIKGAGAIGLLILSVIRHRAQTVIVSDIDDGRLDTAKKLGADKVVNPKRESLEKIAADVVIDAAGEPGGKNQMLKMVRPGGEILMVALGNTMAEIDFSQVITREITIYGTQCHKKEDFETALQFMAEHKICYEEIVTELPLKEGEKAFKHPELGIKIHLFP